MLCLVVLFLIIYYINEENRHGKLYSGKWNGKMQKNRKFPCINRKFSIFFAIDTDKINVNSLQKIYFVRNFNKETA